MLSNRLLSSKVWQDGINSDSSRPVIKRLWRRHHHESPAYLNVLTLREKVCKFCSNARQLKGTAVRYVLPWFARSHIDEMIEGMLAQPCALRPNALHMSICNVLNPRTTRPSSKAKVLPFSCRQGAANSGLSAVVKKMVWRDLKKVQHATRGPLPGSMNFLMHCISSCGLKK